MTLVDISNAGPTRNKDVDALRAALAQKHDDALAAATAKHGKAALRHAHALISSTEGAAASIAEAIEALHGGNCLRAVVNY